MTQEAWTPEVLVDADAPSAPLAPAVAKERLTLFDTTLRDGAQTTGVDFSLADKRRIAAMLDELGLDYVEGGYPGANPTDTEFFAEPPRFSRARFAAFGMVRRAGRSLDNDPGLSALFAARADTIVFVAKSWDYHVRVALGVSLEENLDAIRQSVAAARARGREAIVDCEHFFDGFKANPDYALRVVEAALGAGARWAALCDTNGGSLPHEVERVVKAVCARFPGEKIGVHAHNDTEQAVANSLVAVRAGARMIQGALNGLGERCGNANLTSIIPTLLLKPDFSDRFEIGVERSKLADLSKVSHTLDELLNRAPNRHAPYVGASAFATKAGIHASALAKEPKTYEHVPPEAVGNSRRLLVSVQAGKSNLLAELARIGVRLDKDDPRLPRLLDAVKDKEAQGYAYEGADASFALLARGVLGEVPNFFEVERFRVDVERRHNAQGELVTVSEAVVKLVVDGETMISAAEGQGPVNALDLALRKDLGRYQRFIEDLELVDYRVRVFQGGTDAVTRVLVEFRDASGETWSTIGVSPNIIDASFQALTDALTYKLLKS
ncbi:citramalate synthase [Methylocella sp.]|uniref:citramalate synthase n=1 Tax=Methylocella sp. TaxID=1978226 RepID=UPI003783FCDB